MSSTVDGLVSGLDTTNLIKQLMQVEAASQTRLKGKVSTAQNAVASYQSVNTKVSALKSAANTLTQLDMWRSIGVTSSSSSVAANASSNLNATSGSLTFNVTSLASKQSTTLPVATYADSDNNGTLDTTPTAITVADSITVTPGSYDADGNFTSSGIAKTVDISTTNKSASAIAKALNAAGAGVSAFVMSTSPTEGVLQVTGTKSGAANGFQIDGLVLPGGGSASPTTTAGTSATLSIAGGGGTTYSVSSDTNTFTSLMAGVTITVSKKEDNVTIDATSDVSTIAGKFQAMVDTANAALTEIGNQTAYDPSTRTGAPLTGDFSVRQMSQKILGAVSKGLSYLDPTFKPDPDHPEITAPTINFGTLKKFGIELSDNGSLTFNAKNFTDAYNADPARIQQAGTQLGVQVKKLSDDMNTNLTSVVLGRNNEIDGLNTQISDWDVRLTAKQQALQKQYSDLEVALGKLKNQSNWLSGQLAGLS